MGGALKNTFCLIKDGQAILSQHVGNLENHATHADYRNTLELYTALFEAKPDIIAVDMHPDYLSTQWGRSLAEIGGTTLLETQHHHAHVTACMAENGIPLDTDKVLGIALDGLGLGDDGSLWGGEFLVADYHAFERVAHFAPIPLMGGEKAMHQPWRNTYAHLAMSVGVHQAMEAYPDLELFNYLRKKPLNQLDIMLKRNLNAPPATSAGRLFDAVAAALGVKRERVDYEGQAAIELEALAATAPEEADGYTYDRTTTTPYVLSWTALWKDLLSDLDAGIPANRIAARFHNTLITAIADTARLVLTKRGLHTVALSGGVFHNRLLLQGVLREFGNGGIDTVLTQSQVPANDGGLSLGQGAIAVAHCLKGRAL